MDCLMTKLGVCTVPVPIYQYRYLVQVGTGTVGTYPYLPRWYLQLVLLNIFL